ncbi:MAG: BACON domain-containing protein [Muribaculum sp.]|nr:BACON domain-containing protein [Muribaculum sp.]
MANSGYRVNEDGSVTKINSGGSNNTNNSGGSSDNSGCIWFIIIAVVIGIIVAIANSNSGSSNQTYDDTSVVEEVVVVEEPVEEIVVAPSTTYLRVSDDDIVMNASGGSEDITIYTDGDWYIDVNVASWGHLTTYSNSVVLRLDANTTRSTRTDYFIIKSGSYTKRVNITQFGNTSPSGNITRVWVEHNVYYNGAKGMKIHASYDVENMKDKSVYMYTYFYYGDNSTPLKNPYGNNLSMSSSGIAPYENTTFNDTWHFIPYTNLNMQPGYGSIDLSFDVSIKDGSGNQLDRDENNQFTLSEN